MAKIQSFSDCDSISKECMMNEIWPFWNISITCFDNSFLNGEVSSFYNSICLWIVWWNLDLRNSMTLKDFWSSTFDFWAIVCNDFSNASIMANKFFENELRDCLCWGFLEFSSFSWSRKIIMCCNNILISCWDALKYPLLCIYVSLIVYWVFPLLCGSEWPFPCV